MPSPPTVPLDAVVVGGGVAGLSAAGWLGRYRRRVLVVDGGEPRNRWAGRVHGYLSRDPVDPSDLLAAARAGVDAYPTAEVRRGRVVAAAGTSGGFTVRLDDGSEERAARLVLATGVEDRFPDIEGFLDHYGETVAHCPLCDGYEARGRRVAMLGWGRYEAAFAINLLDWADAVVVVAGRERTDDDDRLAASLERVGIRIAWDRAERFEGSRGDLRGIRLAAGAVIDCDMAFFSTEHRCRSDLAEALGCDLDRHGYVEVDRDGQTSVPGVFAAGDLVPGLKLVQIAAASGAVAGIGCATSLRGEGGGSDSPPPAPDAASELRSP